MGNGVVSHEDVVVSLEPHLHAGEEAEEQESERLAEAKSGRCSG